MEESGVGMAFNVFAILTHLYSDKCLQFAAYRLTARSMAPTICRGDLVLARTGVFAHQDPQRGDLIVFWFHPSFEKPVRYVKRVAAVGGDVVQGSGAEVRVNGRPFPTLLSNSSACSGEVAPDSEADNNQFGPLRVPDGMFFVLGDNRNASWDSRYLGFGLVKRSDIRGRPLFVYWSPYHSRIGTKIQ
jgi:signal peptidase I